MWIFLTDSFLSVVAHRSRPADLLVRARLRGDIERLFPDAEVEDTGTDYRFRAAVPREEVTQAIAARLAGIDYPNYKEAVQEARHDDLLKVWRVLHRVQERARDKKENL